MMNAQELTQLVEGILPGWEFAVEGFPNDEVFNPGGAQAFLMNGERYAHGEGKTPEQAVLVAALRTIANEISK